MKSIEEDEAYGLLCPFARSRGISVHLRPNNMADDAGEDGHYEAGICCTGASCMAWEWDQPGFETRHSPFPASMPPGEGWAWFIASSAGTSWRREVTATRGRCLMFERNG